MQSKIKKINWGWLCVLVFLFIIPTLADACPFCAGQDNKFTDILFPIAILLGTPFAIAGVFIAIIVKHNKLEE